MVEKKSILLTNSGVNNYTGGGIVSLNLLEVLHDLSEVRLILSNQHFPDGRYRLGEYKILAQCLDPKQFGYSEDPFFYDYFAHSMISDAWCDDYDLAMTYGCPFGITVEKLKRDTFCKVICDLAPHNIAISREEHLKLAGRYPFQHLTNEYLLGLYLKQLRVCDKVIVHSHSSAEYITKEAKLKEMPVVIPHGCYPPDEIPDYPDEFMPGYFGSVGIDKGIVYMAGAIINLDMKMVIGGREAANFQIEEKHQHHFETIGQCTLPEFYKRISVYIQPSVIEGFGITPLEAMAFKRPVIVSEGAGMAELITDGEDGFVVPRRDVKAIAEKITYFRDNPSEIKKMGTEARKTAEQYTWDIIKERYKREINALF